MVEPVPPPSPALGARLAELEEMERDLKEHTQSLEELALEASSQTGIIPTLQLKYVEKQISTYLRLLANNLTEQRKLRRALGMDLSPSPSPSAIKFPRLFPSEPVVVPSPPTGYEFEETAPLAILPSRLLKRKVYVWYAASAAARWFLGEIVGGPKDPKQSAMGYTLLVRTSKQLDADAPESLRREPEPFKLTQENYAQTWFLLLPSSSSNNDKTEG